MNVLDDVGTLAFVGLFYDIAGAWCLGAAIFFNGISSIAAQSGSYWDYNPHLLEALCKQKVAAMFGLPLLIIGFVLQAWGSVSDLKSSYIAVAGFGALILVIAFYWLMRQSLSYRSVQKVRSVESISE